jgi:hypothetical protein
MSPRSRTRLDFLFHIVDRNSRNCSPPDSRVRLALPRETILTRGALSDDQAEYQLRDRFSFMRFLGLELEDAVPDAKTLWLYREALAKAGAVEELFDLFDGFLKAGRSCLRREIAEAGGLGAAPLCLNAFSRASCSAVWSLTSPDVSLKSKFAAARVGGPSTPAKAADAIAPAPARNAKNLPYAMGRDRTRQPCRS